MFVDQWQAVHEKMPSVRSSLLRLNLDDSDGLPPRSLVQFVQTLEMRRMHLDWRPVADLVSHIEPDSLRHLELGGAIVVPDLLEHKRSMLLFVETLILSKLANLETLGLEAWGLRGLLGLRSPMRRLRHLGLAGNSIDPPSICHILLQLTDLFPMLSSLDLSAQEQSVAFASLPDYLADCLPNDGSPRKPEPRRTSLLLRESGNWIDYVVEVFEDKQSDALWLSLKRAVESFATICLENSRSKNVQRLAKMLDANVCRLTY